MSVADINGVLYKQLDIEQEIQKKIRKEIDQCASYWKQIEVSRAFLIFNNSDLKKGQFIINNKSSK